MRIKTLYLLGIGGMLVGAQVWAQPASATFAGKNGDIAFTRRSGGISHVWRMQADGSHKRMVGKVNGHSPAWSPGGRALAYARGQQLRVVQAGEDSVLSAQAKGRVLAPQWSYDGTQIAYIREQTGFDKQKKTALFVVPSTTYRTQPLERQLTAWSPHKLGSFSWSPDGARIVYELDNGAARNLYTATLATKQVKKLVQLSDDISSQVQWSPTGAKILYADSSTEAYTIWPDGSHRVVLTDGESRSAVWSPTGQRVAFLEDERGTNVSIRELDDSISEVAIPVYGEAQKLTALSWAPDGTQLLLAVTYTKEAQRQIVVITVQADGRVSTPNRLAIGSLSGLQWQAR